MTKKYYRQIIFIESNYKKKILLWKIMDYKDINEIVNDHFSSFDRLNVENRKISIIQSTRIILSVIKYRILTEISETEKEHLCEIFKVLDSSLIYLVSKNAIADATYEDMRSDISEEDDFISRELSAVQSHNEAGKEEPKGLKGLKELKEIEELKGIKIVNNDNNNTNDSDDDDGSSLNSIYSASLNSPKIVMKKTKDKNKSKGKEEEETPNDAIFEEPPKEEEDVKELFSKSVRLYLMDKLERINDDRFHRLLISLKGLGIYTHAPYKLYNMLKHHSTFFKTRKDVETCSVYSLIKEEGFIDVIFEYFSL